MFNNIRKKQLSIKTNHLQTNTVRANLIIKLDFIPSLQYEARQQQENDIERSIYNNEKKYNITITEYSQGTNFAKMVKTNAEHKALFMGKLKNRLKETTSITGKMIVLQFNKDIKNIAADENLYALLFLEEQRYYDLIQNTSKAKMEYLQVCKLFQSRAYTRQSNANHYSNLSWKNYDRPEEYVDYNNTDWPVNSDGTPFQYDWDGGPQDEYSPEDYKDEDDKTGEVR